VVGKRTLSTGGDKRLSTLGLGLVIAELLIAMLPMPHQKQFHLARMKTPRPMSCRTRRSAFTLVELMVVLAIAAVVSGITLSGYRSVADGNKRVSCQTNLRQIYSALQLYSKDNNGFYPDFNPAQPAGQRHLGLWALYSLPREGAPDEPALLNEQFRINGFDIDHKKPYALYVKSRKQLHCPADVDHEVYAIDNPTNQIDMNYLSYQVLDGTEWTYQPWRGVTNDALWNANRQLMRFTNTSGAVNTWTRRFNKPASDAVITWCMWHRNVRDLDNVLFASGAVRPVPRVQTNPNPPDMSATPAPPAEPTELTGWNRKPPF
jgi:prepilin-type N-terminal cleavage/methylation domain-containing protein